MSAKKFKKKPEAKKSRKQLRKEERKNKKIRRNDYYTSRNKPGQFVLAKKTQDKEVVDEHIKSEKNKKQTNVSKNPIKNKLAVEESREKEKKQQVKLQKEMQKQRKKQLLNANLDEDRNIKHLEKQLKLNKRKSKSVPASFINDGLDYLLEVCEPDNLESSALAEQQLAEVNDEFEEDLVLMLGSDKKTGKQKNKKPECSPREDIGSSSELEDFEEEKKLKSMKRSSENDRTDNKKIKPSLENSDVSSDEEFGDLNDMLDEEEESDNIHEDMDNDELNEGSGDSDQESKDDGTWQDIYGRLRSKDGNVINEKNQKYIPPAARIQEESSTDKQRAQKLERLRKQLKGLINRLAESNMYSITTQIEELYMNNSRNDMNNTITNLIIEALVSHILAPERLLMEHILLIVILHANVGIEVGAHFLQTIVKMFDENISNAITEDKKLDNIILILAQLYNFKLFESKLIYEIIDKLSESFGEKDVECILHILRTVGFNLRKDNPIALKNLILSLQKKASNASDEMRSNSRVKFMLDILLAVKNNNVMKIPNYHTTYSEHLKKIMKGFIRKGNYVSQLNISLEDLLKVDEKGKWWVVGSAWTGNSTEASNIKDTSEKTSFSHKLLELASKQRMNTDARKNIFCIIMSAEDYLDAFEKLLKLALKNQQDREIINVILHCCLQEKTYNPYYATLAQKFCECDRKYQMTIKYSIWDKLKALKEHSATQISNLAKLLSHLFIEKGLPISTLKIVQFSELDKLTLRFIRQILIGILLHEDLEVCRSVFENVSCSEKLKMFRESLRLFLHHFLLKNLESQRLESDKKELLQQRIKVVEKMLTGKSNFYT